MGRLLAEGNEGKFALIKEEEIVGLFDTFNAAYAEGLRRYLLGPYLIQQVREWERMVRTWEYVWFGMPESFPGANDARTVRAKRLPQAR